MIYKDLVRNTYLFLFIGVCALSLILLFFYINPDVFPRNIIIAAITGLGIGLLIEVIAGADFGRPRNRQRDHDYSINYYEDSKYNFDEMISRYIAIVRYVLSQNNPEPYWDLESVEKYIDNLSRTANLTRNIINMEEMSPDDVEVLYDTQRMIVNYMLSTTREETHNLAPIILEQLGRLATVGMRSAINSRNSLTSRVGTESIPQIIRES